VGSATRRVSFVGTISRKYGAGSNVCPARTPMCVTGSAWLTFTFSAAVFLSTTGAASTTSKLAVDREVDLGSNLTRDDEVVVDVPRPRFTGAGAHVRVSVTTTAGSEASGSAVVAATGAPQVQHRPCRLHGKQQVETGRGWQAHFTSRMLAVREEVYGILRIPSGQGLIQHVYF
jgi:hypothetical protein